MNDKTADEYDEFVRRVGELARYGQKLAHQAVEQYSVELDAILKTHSREPRRIERCLDGMLGFLIFSQNNMSPATTHSWNVSIKKLFAYTFLDAG